MKSYWAAVKMGAIAAILPGLASCDPPTPEAFAMAHRRAHCEYMTGSRLCQADDSSPLDVSGPQDTAVKSTNSGRVGAGGR